MKRPIQGWGLFALTLFVSILVLALPMAATVFYLQVPARGAEASAPKEDTYLPQPEDAITLLLAAYEQGKAPHTFLLARFDPAGGAITVAPLPAQTMVEDSGRFDALSGVWKKNGPARAVKALENTLSVGIDRYAAIRLDGFIKVVDTVGTIEYRVEEALELDGGAILLREGEQLLDGRKLAALLTYAGYPGGEEERLRLLGDLAVRSLNQRLPTLTPSLTELVFSAAVNATQTDVSYLDFEVRKKAIQYMTSLPSPARPLEVEGSYNEGKNTFLLTAQSAGELQLAFPLKKAEAPSSQAASATT